MPLNPDAPKPPIAVRARRAAQHAGRAVRWGSFAVGLLAGWLITIITLLVLAL